MIFAICLVDENSNKASARKFIEEIERTGIRDGCARVKMMAKLNNMFRSWSCFISLPEGTSLLGLFQKWNV